MLVMFVLGMIVGLVAGDMAAPALTKAIDWIKSKVSPPSDPPAPKA